MSLIHLLNAEIKLFKVLQPHQQGNIQAFFFYAFQTIEIYCILSTQKVLPILLQNSVFGGSSSTRADLAWL